jgi:hypothetical protein
MNREIPGIRYWINKTIKSEKVPPGATIDAIRWTKLKSEEDIIQFTMTPYF